jgi:hypothetical protein
MRLTILILFVLFSTCLRANEVHPYSITMVHVDLQDKKIVLTIKTNAEDLLYFHKLEFDSALKINGHELRAAAQSHRKIIETGFYILDQHKKPLPGTLASTDLSSLDGIAAFDIMSLLKYPLSYTLEFKLNDGTELLEFHQELGTAGLPAVSFLTISRNNNMLVQNIELTKDKPFIMVRDAVSVRSPDENTFMVSYITVSDSRVVHELTIPIEILKSFVSFGNTNQDSLLNAMKKFISESSSVEINNTLIQPEITALIVGNESSVQYGENSMVHLRIEYSLTDLPKEVTISWENFNWKMRWFKSMVDAFGEKSEYNFSRFQPTLEVERNVKLKRE